MGGRGRGGKERVSGGRGEVKCREAGSVEGEGKSDKHGVKQHAA